MRATVATIVFFFAALALPGANSHAGSVQTGQTPPRGVVGEEPPTGAKNPFVGARYDEAARVVRFTPLVTVNWEKVARGNFHRVVAYNWQRLARGQFPFPGFNIDRPPAEVVDYLRDHIFEAGSGATVTVRAPLEPVLANGTYSLILSAGILPIGPSNLEASVGFGFDQSKPPKLLADRSFSGEVVSRRIVSGGGGGIVYWSAGHERPQRVEQARAEIHDVGGHAVLSYVDERSHASAEWPEPWKSKLLAAYGVSIANQRYLFVAWPPDQNMTANGCLRGFTLFAVRETLEEVALSIYDCDV